MEPKLGLTINQKIMLYIPDEEEQEDESEPDHSKPD